MQFSLTDLLFLMVLFLALFLAIFLFSANKGKQSSNKLLGLFFLSIGLNLADSFLLLKGAYLQVPALALWGSNLLLLCGPCIYFYTQSVIYSNFLLTPRRWLHFLPFVVIFVITEVAYLAAGYAQQIKILDAVTQRSLPAATYYFSIFIYIHFFYYLISSLRLANIFSRAAANRYADERKVTVGWLKVTIVFFMCLMLFTLTGGYLSFQSLAKPYFFVLGLTVFMLLGFIVWLLFSALRNPAILAVMDENEVAETVQQATAPTAIPSSEKTALLQKLQAHMQEAKPYLEGELSLDVLAAQLSAKPKLLSQVINEMLHQNFFEFVNQYRIEEAKQMLTNPADKKITVQEVMYQVGFNSKSSFNTLFKKATGVTPTQFKQENMG